MKDWLNDPEYQKRKEMIRRKREEEMKEMMPRIEKMMENAKKRRKEEKKAKRESNKRYLEVLARSCGVPLDMMPEYTSIIKEEEERKTKKAQKKNNPRKEIRAPQKTQIVDQNLEEMKCREVMVLRNDAPEGIRELDEGGKQVFFNLFSKMTAELIPTKRGSEGMRDRLCVDALLRDMAPFINGFKLVPRREFTVSYLSKTYPYTGRSYKQYVWEFREMEPLQTFLGCFVNFTPSWEILWVRDFHQPGTFVRVDNPSQSEHKYLLENDEESKKKREEFYKEHLTTGHANNLKLKIVVGEVPSNKKRISTAKLVYTINQEPHLLGGQLKLCLNYEVREGGTSIGGKVTGEPKGGKCKVINGEEHVKSIQEAAGRFSEN